jgi:AcrR family transcriptional regulator
VIEENRGMIAPSTTSNPPNDPVKAPEGQEPSSRTRILLAALPLFTDRGYSAVSMQDIADTVGMTKAALYYHFTDKEELFGQVYAFEMERISHELETLLAETDDLGAALELTARYLLDTRRGDLRRLHADFSRYVAADRKLALLKGNRHPYAVLRPKLEQAKAKGKTRDINVPLVTGLFFAMVSRQMSITAQADLLKDATSELSNEEIAREIARLVLFGIQPSEEYPTA